MPTANPPVTFETTLFAMCGVPEVRAWMPVAMESIEFRRTCAFDSERKIPVCAFAIVLSATNAEDRMSAIPDEPPVIVSRVKLGEVSIATRGRSNWSNVLHETDPFPVTLNWTPTGGMSAIVLFRDQVIRFPAVPSATSRPSTKRLRPGSTRTVVPARIVRVAPERTVTDWVITYAQSARPHVVSTAIGPRTYVMAAARGVTANSAPNETATTSRTVATLGTRGRLRGASMGSSLCGPAFGLARSLVRLLLEDI